MLVSQSDGAAAGGFIHGNLTGLDRKIELNVAGGKENKAPCSIVGSWAESGGVEECVSLAMLHTVFVGTDHGLFLLDFHSTRLLPSSTS